MTSNVIDEHFVPNADLNLDTYIQNGDIIGVHHLIRYKWVIKRLTDLNPIGNILDVACGSGYGSYLLAKEFPRANITGADYDPSAIKQAQEAYSLPNLEYKLGNVTDWNNTIGRSVFQFIISFDTLEHVEHRDIMMENLVEHLDEKGNLFFSTPCGGNINNLKPDWKFHKIEYCAASLYDFLKRYFREIIGPEDPSFPHIDIFQLLKEKNIPYLLRLNPIICKSPIIINNPYKPKPTQGNIVTG